MYSSLTVYRVLKSRPLDRSKSMAQKNRNKEKGKKKIGGVVNSNGGRDFSTFKAIFGHFKSFFLKKNFPLDVIYFYLPIDTHFAYVLGKKKFR